MESSSTIARLDWARKAMESSNTIARLDWARRAMESLSTIIRLDWARRAMESLSTLVVVADLDRRPMESSSTIVVLDGLLGAISPTNGQCWSIVEPSMRKGRFRMVEGYRQSWLEIESSGCSLVVRLG
jgi:hypothetical protein